MKISELTENDVIHIRNKKEAKHVWRLLRKEGFSWHDLGTNTWKTFKECYKQCFNAMCINYFDRCYSDISTYKGRNIIPASKLLKQSISKKDLQKALSKVGEELSSMNERLGKLEAKSEPKTANGIEVHFDEVTEGLPEKWCVLRTPTNHKLINKWAGSQWGEAYYFEPTGYLNSDASTSDTIQEGYTEITFETFKKYVLKEEVKKAVELETGKWYKDDVRKLLFCFSGEYDDDGDPTGYGFVFQRWNNNKDGWKGVKTPATETEVFEALKAEACKQYKVGKTVFDNWSNCKITLNDLTRFDYSNGNLFVLNLNNSKTHLLGSNGQWATIIPQPEIDFSKAGQLVKNSVGDILLTTGEQSHSKFEAIVIKHHLSKKPKIRAAKSCFTLCTEPVTLQN